MRTTLPTTKGWGALCLVSLFFADLMLLGAGCSAPLRPKLSLLNPR